jgi:VanZ family protein
VNADVSGRGRAYWIASALWFVVILSFSRESFASGYTEGWMSRLLTYAGMEVSASVLAALNLIVRKCAHLVEYGVFGALLYRAWNLTWLSGRAWLGASALVLVAASIDEGMQALLPWRSGQIGDVLLDFLGGTAGAWLMTRISLRPPT